MSKMTKSMVKFLFFKFCCCFETTSRMWCEHAHWTSFDKQEYSISLIARCRQQSFAVAPDGCPKAKVRINNYSRIYNHNNGLTIHIKFINQGE